MTWVRTLCLGLLLFGSTFSDSDNYANNPFLHGFANDVNAFIQDQQRLAAVDTNAAEDPSHSVANRAIDGFSAPTYLPPVERKLICSAGQVCVSKYVCHGGVFTADLSFARTECIPDNEVCCTYRPPPPPPPPKPTSPPAVACLGRFEACVAPQQCIQGVWQANGLGQPPYANRCYAPEVCCRIPDPETTALTDDGYVVHVPQVPLITPTIQPRPTFQPRPIVTATYQPQPIITSTYQPIITPTYQPRPIITSTYQPRPVITPTYQPRPVITPTYQPRPVITVTTSQNYLPPDRIAQPTIIHGEGQLSLPINPPPKNTIEDPLANLPVTCAAALNCTEIQYCTAIGFISKTPVSLTPDQEAFRVPLTDCQDPVKGIIGKCCRDPDYVDPWPISQLGQYTDPKVFGDDGQYRPVASISRPQIAPKPAAPIRNQHDLSLPIAAAPQPIYTAAPQPIYTARPVIATAEPVYSARPVFAAAQPVYTARPVIATAAPAYAVQAIASTPAPIYSSQLGPAIYPAPATCGIRNPNASPAGSGPYDAAFSEFPWQVMVLREATKTILCGGAIVSDDLVVTSAACIQGYKPYDILVKAGEWKLGRDEEPLNYQLIRASRIEAHPSSGMATIYLEQKLKFAVHIAPICLDASDPTPSDSCVTTGWGQQAISIHLQDAVMHQSPVSIVPTEQCQGSGNGYTYGPGLLCGRPQIDSCELDVGSALACLNPQGQYVLKGIYVSSGQCGSNSPTISFARPDIAWIQGSSPAVNQISSFRPVQNEYLPPRH